MLDPLRALWYKILHFLGLGELLADKAGVSSENWLTKIWEALWPYRWIITAAVLAILLLGFLAVFLKLEVNIAGLLPQIQDTDRPVPQELVAITACIVVDRASGRQFLAVDCLLEQAQGVVQNHPLEALLTVLVLILLGYVLGRAHERYIQTRRNQ